MKRSLFVIPLIFISVAIEAQADRNAPTNKIIIEGQAPPAYADKKILLKSIPNYIADLGYDRSKVQIDSLQITNGVVKWEKEINEPLFVYSPLIDILPSNIGTRMEPGDSISIKYVDGKVLFSGRGAEKLGLKYQLDRINDSLNPIEKKMAYIVKSLQDFLDWNTYLNKKLDIMLPIIEAHKSRLSPFAYNNIKVDVLTAIEVTRVSKFNWLRGQTPDEPRMNENKVAVNQFGLTNRQFAEIFDSTLNGPAARWIEYEAPYVNDPYYLYYKLRMEAYRKKGVFFRRQQSDSSILGNKAQVWVQLYNMGKKKYSGRTREEFLAYLFWFIRGAFYYCGFEPEIEEILADYYSQSKYPEYSAEVKEEELRYRERYSRAEASNFILTDASGKAFSKEMLAKKITVLDFWFTGCAGCIDMAPVLKMVKDHFRNDTNVIFINISIDKDREKWLKSIAQKKYTSGEGINLYTGGQGKDHEMIKKYGVTGYPTLYVIDAFDKVVWSNTIPDPRKDQGKLLIELIRKKLALMKDGPYVFHGNKSTIAFNIDGAALSSKTLNSGTVISFPVQTDQLEQTFTVSLRSSLTIPPSEYEKPEKMLALSDIEGNFDAFRKLLQSNGVIDQNFNWTFGKGHLVFGGDMFDRGSQVTECLWLVYSLEEKARTAGGYVHFILGNHEIMNLKGINRYTDKKYVDNAALINKTLPELYNNNSELGKWLRTKNIVEKIGDILFVHGGISRELNETAVTITEINQLARPYYSTLKKDYGTEKLNVILSDKVGPYWYRGYYKSRSAPAIVDSTLQKFKINHIVTGHTIVADTISVHINGKVINTDTQHAKGISEALLIEGDKYYRVNYKGQRILLDLFDPKPKIDFYSTQ